MVVRGEWSRYGIEVEKSATVRKGKLGPSQCKCEQAAG